ncbi:MAG TPA: ATP-binding protein, partial [Nitrospiraceae bacterium]|nr:ATP-binding protein [Nitrospiraceae bacterium]
GNFIERLELRPVPGMERVGRDLHRVMQEVHKATAIVSHLRTFGRGAATIKEPISIHTVLKSAVLLVGEQFRQMGIEVELQLCSGEPCVLGNAIQLEQVVLNLLNNARDAVREAATKQIRIGTALNKPNIEISMHDTGSGIEPRLLSRVFDPFFTTKPVGQGTGLGLSITYGIVQDHQGTIHVESRPGRGATFRITLPTLS